MPEQDADLAQIISERRKQVAQESECEAAAQEARFKATVESEVARRFAGDAAQRPRKTKGPPLVATAPP